MARYASLDVGSNTVKLTIAERDGAGRFTPIVDMARTTRLGERIHDRRLGEAAIRRTLDALAEFRAMCEQHGVEALAAVGTSALRDAVNQEEFVRRAGEIGVPVEPISGDEEARLSFLAVRRDPLWRECAGLAVIDIGGGSTEIVLGDGASGGPALRTSVNVGGVRLTESLLRGDPPTVAEMAAANAAVSEALQVLGPLPANYALVGVGGTLVNMASVKLGLPSQEPERIHGTRLSADDVESQVALYAERTIAERKAIVGLDPQRADIILAGALILSHLLSRAAAESVHVSCRGLRWGVLYDRFG